MTRIAGATIYLCPGCAKPIQRTRLSSLNTFDAEVWSDGASTIYWAEALRPLMRCPSCDVLMWEEDLIPAGDLPREPFQKLTTRMERFWVRMTGDDWGLIEMNKAWDAAPLEWRQAPSSAPLRTVDLWTGLKQVPQDRPDREFAIRRWIWWLANDVNRPSGHRRKSAEESEISPQQAEANACRLLELHAQAGTPSMEYAELLRLRGRFDEALTVLAALKFDDRMPWLQQEVEKRRGWTLAHDPQLKLLKEAGW